MSAIGHTYAAEDTRTVEAPSIAAFARVLSELPSETRADIIATEHGRPWARVTVGPYGGWHLSAFPVDAQGVRGDTSRRGMAGVILLRPSTDSHAASLVVKRAARMHDA